MFVADEQVALDVDVERWRQLALAMLTDEGVEGDVEVSLLFVDRDTIQTLNATYMGSDQPTDVLAFPLDGDVVEMGRHPRGGETGPDRSPVDRDELPLLLGDVVICPAVAEANAPDHTGTTEDELALLVVHGLLHLLGMDHAEPAERAAMQAAERRHLAQHWRLPPRDPWSG